MAIVLFLAAGCASTGASAAAVDQIPPDGWIERADRLSKQGRLTQAEQLLVLAWQRGASSERVLPRLLELCIRANRLRRALDYVSRALEQSEAPARLHYLAATLHIALAQPQQAIDAARLAASRIDAAWLLAAETAEGAMNDAAQARQYYERYLRSSSSGEGAVRARRALQRLEAAARRIETTPQDQSAPQGQSAPQHQAAPLHQAAPQRSETQLQHQAAPQRSETQLQHQAAPQRMETQPQHQAAPQRSETQPQHQAAPQMETLAEARDS